MVWLWPPTEQDHDTLDWTLVQGRYDYNRWRDGWQQLFDTHVLIHNRRVIQKTVVSKEGDGAFVVVDIDTLWMDKKGQKNHWKGRACKVYTKVGNDWKLIMHTGLLDYKSLKCQSLIFLQSSSEHV